MSQCYLCTRDDIYGSSFKRTKSPRQELVWVCPDCRPTEGAVIFSGQGRFYGTLGLILIICILGCITGLIAVLA